MILDDTAVKAMAQAKANQDMQAISIYRRKSGEFIIGRDISLIRQMLGPQEQLTYIETIKPETVDEV